MRIKGLDKGINQVAKEVAQKWRLGVSPIILVSGKIGTGKTTFQQLLIRKLLENGLPAIGVNFADRLKQYVFLLTGKLKSLELGVYEPPTTANINEVINQVIKSDIELVLNGGKQVVEYNGCCWECNKAELLSAEVLNGFYGKQKVEYITHLVSAEIRRKLTYALLEYNANRFDLRKLLQFVGTEVFRETVGGIYWSYLLLNRVLRYVDAQPQPQIFVVGDWRFISEYQTINCFIKMKNLTDKFEVITVRLHTDENIASKRLGIPPTLLKQLWFSHISETQLDAFKPSFFSFNIENNSQINFLP